MSNGKHGLRPCAVAFAVALALGLSGCGGGGGGGANVRPTQSPPPPIVGGSDFTGGNVNVDAGNTTVWPADIGGSIDLVKGGAGALVLTGTDSYTGGTTISAGTLQLGNGGTTGWIVGDVTDNGSLVFDRSDNVTFTGIVSGNGSLTQVGTGRLTLTGNNTYTGGTTISAGILQLGNGGTTGSIVGDVNDNGTLAFDRSDDVGFAGTITGIGGLIKAGSGALTLTGANGYTGATQVDAGSLYVDGNQSAATGAITIANGATLGGKGILGGDVTVADGGTLAPGSKDAIGTLTVNGDLNLSAGSTLDYSFSQANTADAQPSDLVNVKGNLTLDGTLDVSVVSGGELGLGVYRLINYDGTLVNNGLTLSSGSSALLVQTGVAQQVNLINTQGMTFSFWDGDAGPKNNGVVNGGNGTWQSGNPLSNTNWTDASGAVNTVFSDRSFAVFQATPGTVTVDDGNGDINAAGMQFASNGYVIQGDTIHLVGSADDPTHSIIRVGDGTVAGAGYMATINSVLSGNSALVKTDAGTLVLGGNNTYTGGTTINSGTLQLGNGGTTGSVTGDITDNGSLVFNRSDDLSFGGVISGSGLLTQAGSGALILTSNNTYTGGTTISNGTLQLGNGGATGSITGNVMNNGSLVFNRSDDVSFGSVISGSGSLTQAGGGTLTLSGTNTYSGGTTVSSGVLEIASGEPGTGTLTAIYSGYQAAVIRLDGGVSLSNHVVLAVATLDNAGTLVDNVDSEAVDFNAGSGTIMNHDGGRIEGKNAVVASGAVYGVIKNSSRGAIEGEALGVGLSSGEVSNDGVGSVISSSSGIAIQIAGTSAAVANTGGGTITGGSTAIYLSQGGVVTNGGGSTIETTDAGTGCQDAGGCSIFVPTSTDGLARALTLTNAGTIIGDIKTDPTGYNSATLWAGSSIKGNLGLGPKGMLTLQGDAGTVEAYSNAVGGTTVLSSLSKYGDGTWIIDNNAFDSVAGVGVVGGTLQVGNGGTEGSIGQGGVSLYSTLVFDRSDDVTFTGTIGGGGGTLVQAGTGTLALTADYLSPDEYVIKSGTLQIGNGSAARTAINLGMFSANVLDNGVFVFDNGNDTSFSGSVSGAGSLVKEGTGTLTMWGNNTYSGSTTVSDGTLLTMGWLPGNATVGTGSVLGGVSYAGTIGLPGVAGSLANAGTVIVRGGNSSVGGSYAQASTGTLAVNLGSKLAVANTATLNGGTLEITGADSGYVSNTHTNILTAGNGVTGTFAQLVKDSGVVFTSTIIQYDANNVWLDTTGLNVTTAAAGNGVSYTPASMGSARRVQAAFEQVDSKIAAGNLSGVSGDFLQAAGKFQQAPTLQAAQASLQSLSGELHAASAALTFEAIDASSRALSDRFDTLLGKGTGFGMWTQSLDMGGDMARTGYDGVGFQLNGWLVGSDRQIGRSGVAGFAFGQSQGVQQADQGFGRDNSRSTESMLYAGWLNGNWYTQGRVGFGHFQQDINRQVLLGYSAQAVSTQYSGNYSVAYGESGLHLNHGGYRITPFVDVEYASIDRGGFAEQGAGGFGLRSNAQALDRWQAGLGVRAGRHWDLGEARAVDFSAHAQWQRTLASQGDVFDASFVGMQQWQPLTGIGLSRYSGLLGFDLDAMLSTRAVLKFGYDYQMGQRVSGQTMSARLNVAF